MAYSKFMREQSQQRIDHGGDVIVSTVTIQSSANKDDCFELKALSWSHSPDRRMVTLSMPTPDGPVRVVIQYGSADRCIIQDVVTSRIRATPARRNEKAPAKRKGTKALVGGARDFDDRPSGRG